MLKKVSIFNMSVFSMLCAGVYVPVRSAFFCDTRGIVEELEDAGFESADHKIAELTLEAEALSEFVLNVEKDHVFTYLASLITDCREGEEWVVLKALGVMGFCGDKHEDFLNNVRVFESGETLLMLAAKAGNVSVVKTLLLKGADPFLEDKGGRSVFFMRVRIREIQKKRL